MYLLANAFMQTQQPRKSVLQYITLH